MKKLPRARAALRKAAAGVRAVYHNITESENATAKLQRTLEGIRRAVHHGSTGIERRRSHRKSSQVTAPCLSKIAAEQLIRFRAVSAAKPRTCAPGRLPLRSRWALIFRRPRRLFWRALLAPLPTPRAAAVMASARPRHAGTDSYPTVLGQTQKAQAIVKWRS